MRKSSTTGGGCMDDVDETLLFGFMMMPIIVVGIA